MDKVKEIANQIFEEYKDYGVDRKEIEEKLKKLLIEFRVPEGEAIRTIRNYIIREYGAPATLRREKITEIGEIDNPEKWANKWITVKAKVAHLWENPSPSIAQVGLLGDETGYIRFLVWTKAKKQPVEEGKCYIFRNVVVDDYGGVLRLNVTKISEIEEIDEDIQLKPVEELSQEVEVVGALVAIQQNSGLIQRCGVEGCNRVIKMGKCPEHGKTTPKDDLRIKGVIDDGRRTYEVIINEEGVKALTGIDLKKAKKIAEETLDRGAVLVELKKQLLGKYLKVVGRATPRYLLANQVELFRPDIRKEIEKVKAMLEG
jgi:replication factor A1